VTDNPPNRAERRSWPKRRHWLDRVAGERRLTSGCKSWMLLLAGRSDDAGKPVWGNQEKMADQLGRCARSVRRYLVEAEELGYIKCFRSKPQRDRSTGRWHRRKANAYYFCIPPRDTGDRSAPRRRQRAPYCVVRPGQEHRFHLPDNHGRSSPSGVRQHGVAPPTNYFRDAPQPENHWTGAMTDIVKDSIVAARAALLRAKGRH
jgi:hypothetical protein